MTENRVTALSSFIFLQFHRIISMHGTLRFKQEKKVSRFIKLVLRNSRNCTDMTIISQLALRARPAFVSVRLRLLCTLAKYIHDLALSCF